MSNSASSRSPTSSAIAPPPSSGSPSSGSGRSKGLCRSVVRNGTARRRQRKGDGRSIFRPAPGGRPIHTVGAMDVIACRELTKRFGPTVAVDRLDLQVGAGQVYGFLGPNGAGKTTTIRMLLGLVAPTGGQIDVLGRRLPDP